MASLSSHSDFICRYEKNIYIKIAWLQTGNEIGIFFEKICNLMVERERENRDNKNLFTILFKLKRDLNLIQIILLYIMLSSFFIIFKQQSGWHTATHHLNGKQIKLNYQKCHLLSVSRRA